MRDLVRGLRGEHTVVVSSHILNEISETCDRILVIKEGAICWAGTEREISSQVSQVLRVNIVLRASGGDAGPIAERAKAALSGVAGVDLVEATTPVEKGDGLAGVSVSLSSDVRDELCRALVNSGLGVLEIARQRESEGLERMFLELVGEATEPGQAKRRKKRQRDDADSGAAEGSKEAS
jgi:ABC-2 type transport system ATP-binding protein